MAKGFDKSYLAPAGHLLRKCQKMLSCIFSELFRSNISGNLFESFVPMDEVATGLAGEIDSGHPWPSPLRGICCANVKKCYPAFFPNSFVRISPGIFLKALCQWMKLPQGWPERLTRAIHGPRPCGAFAAQMSKNAILHFFRTLSFESLRESFY